MCLFNTLFKEACLLDSRNLLFLMCLVNSCSRIKHCLVLDTTFTHFMVVKLGHLRMCVLTCSYCSLTSALNVQVKLSLRLEGCAVLPFNITTGPTPSEISPLDSRHHAVEAREAMARDGKHTLHVSINATAYSECRYLNLCFQRGSSVETFEIEDIMVHTCATGSPATVSHARAWLSALGHALSLLPTRVQVSRTRLICLLCPNTRVATT